MIDVVYPLSKGSYMDDFELRYSLRSIEANLLDLQDVYIVGEMPEWCKNIYCIPASDPYKNNKSANIISKILLACSCHGIDTNFLRMSDDQYILKPMYSHQIKPVYNWDMNKYDKWDKNNKWHNLLQRTRGLLNDASCTAFNYETHTPMVVDKRDFVNIMLRTDFGSDPGYVTNSIYYNHVIYPEYHTKIDSSTRAVFMDMETPFKITDDHQWLCHNDLGFSYDLMNFLKSKFPNPSKYEQ